jgi:hypothetical protein
LVFELLEHLNLLVVFVKQHVLFVFLHFIILVKHLVVELIIRILPVVGGLAMLLKEQSQFLLNLLLVRLPVLAAPLAALRGFLLKALSVPERIEGVIS